MEHDEWENYLAVLRDQRKTDRERELEKKLNEIADRKRRELVAESQPIYKELAEIEARKPPMPVKIDGRVYEYTGPWPGRS